jgi:mannitol/fructose-specific phosphotransferase system IIA component (Ntr-type)
MNPSTRTPEGEPNHCPICGKAVVIEPSLTRDATCPHCGALLWFPDGGAVHDICGLPVLTLNRDAAASKKKAIHSILKRMANRGQFRHEDCDSITRAVLKREMLGSMGIGRGMAIPHGNHPAVTRLTGAVAMVPDGVDFASLDGQPVHIICLLLSPVDRPRDHLRAIHDLIRRLRGIE